MSDTPISSSPPLGDDPAVTDALFARYVTGDASANEQTIITAYLAEHPEEQRLVEHLRTLDYPVVDSIDARKAWGVFARRRLTGARSVSAHVGQRMVRAPMAKRGGHFVAASIAGAIAMIAAVIGIGRLMLAPEVQRTPAHRHSTGIGERSTVRLADGSVVTLAPGTTVIVEGGFGQHRRAVTLTGEAYFDVAAVSGAPFVVQTGNITTEVLGTSFDVRRYATDSTVQIAVVHGKVMSQNTQSRRGRITLTAGMMARVSDSVPTVLPNGDVTSYTEWTRGHLDFQHTPVPDVLDMMGHWYGLQFAVADSSLLKETVSGRFDFPTTKDALDVLELALGTQLDVERHGSTTLVTLGRRGRRNGSSASPAPSRRESPRTHTPDREVGR